MVIQAGMFHEQYQAGRSREMMQRAMISSKAEQDEEDDDEEAVSKLLARSELELELFTHLDEQRKQQSSLWHLPEHWLPAWLFDWAVRGTRANEL